MPECKFTLSGSIEDFTRIDNLYRSLKREGEKLLTTWEINAEVSYTEKQGDKPEE